MPKRATTRQTTQRAAPYQLRSVSNTSQANNMAVVVSPMVPLAWATMPPQHRHSHSHTHSHSQHQQYSIQDWQQQQQYPQYQQEVMLAQNAAMVTPYSGAPPVQQVQASSIPVGTSHSHSNSGSGPWTAEMDEILIENHRRLKWDQIAERFFNNTKTGNACRKRHARVIMERKEPARWDQERVQKVINAYNRESMREKMWKPLAEATNERWQDVERLCYGQGFRVLTSKHGYGHTRRRSRAASHRSQGSTNSDDGGIRPYDDDEPTDDSGIGADFQTGQHHLQLPHADYHPHSHPRSDTYQEDIPGYGAEYYPS